MTACLLVICLVGFVFGIVHLFQLRFSAGDIYPPYSSLRTDPLGTKLLYESLRRVPGLSADRFFRSNLKLNGGARRVLFVIGAAPSAIDDMSPDDYRAIKNFVYQGGRAVITLLPADARTYLPQKPDSRHPPATNDEPRAIETVSLLATNGLMIKNDDLSEDDNSLTGSDRAQPDPAFANLPVTSWHSANYFTGLSRDWKVVYRLRDRPVLIERSYGAGSLVLSSDSYFASNEALCKERHSELLVWLMGGRPDIIFDETHLGVEEQLGIVSLMRQYHLEGAIAGLFLLAGLFVWKNSVSLVPPAGDATGGGEFIAGKESSAGFASLLRRSVAPSDILPTIFEEWKTARGRDPRTAARLPLIEKLMDEEKSRPRASRRPLETYQAIHRIVTERNL